MAVDFLSILSGQTVSSGYFNVRADLPVVIVCPASINPAELRIQCATSSGASASGDSFGDIQIQQQPGNLFASPFTVASVGLVQTRPTFIGPIGPLPTPFFRLFVSTGPTIASNTYTVMTGRYN